jgi:hypothetical protein
MTVNVIDINFHGSAIPSSGYVGPGNLVGNPLVSTGGTTRVSGYFTGAGNVTNIPLGTLPTYVGIFDITNNISWEWFRGMPATDVFKTVAAGTRTVDTTSAIVVTTDNAGNATVALTAALAASSAVLCYSIEC